MCKNQDPSKKEGKDKKWIIFVIVGLIIGLVLGILISMLYLLKEDYLFVIVIASTASFFAALFCFYLLSEDRDFNTAEIRRSIAVAFLVCYFLLLGLSDKIDANVKGKYLSELLLRRFDYIILVIMGFYFGGRSIEKASERLSNRSKALKDKKEVSR